MYNRQAGYSPDLMRNSVSGKGIREGNCSIPPLIRLLRDFTFQNEEIWKIITWKGITYFQSFSVIFAYNGKTVKVIHPPGLITCFAQCQ